MKTHPAAFLLAPVILLASCAGDSKPQANSTPELKPLSQRMNENNGYVQDTKGNWKPRSDRRSEFEGRGASHFAGKDFKKQEYKAGDYAKKSWWGNKEYGRTAYSGNTDASRLQKSSALQGQGARESGSAANVQQDYRTGDYGTGSARESAAAPVQGSSVDRIENRRDSFEQPEIIDWREQRSVTMGESKSILGR